MIDLPLFQTDLAYIAAEADTRNEENLAFRDFIRNSSENIDAIVLEINETVEAAVDCTSCGNCCRSLMINVEQHEFRELARHLEKSPEALKADYFEESTGGQLVINTIPCHFLSDNKCTVYEFRFEGCRAFPHLREPGFATRMFGLIMHYGRCPIIYNVFEALKRRTKFVPL